jgi:hypothetical protein
MSTNGGNWAELASQNERVITLGGSAPDSMEISTMDARSQWAELASQSERLVDTADPLFRLASSGHRPAGLRRVAGAAV